MSHTWFYKLRVTFMQAQARRDGLRGLPQVKRLSCQKFGRLVSEAAEKSKYALLVARQVRLVMA